MHVVLHVLSSSVDDYDMFGSLFGYVAYVRPLYVLKYSVVWCLFWQLVWVKKNEI